jgi:hypothetical protein
MVMRHEPEQRGVEPWIWVLLFLLISWCVIAMPADLPVSAVCEKTTDHVQETRVCKAWLKTLQKQDGLTGGVGAESSLIYKLQVEFRDELIFCSFESFWSHAGLQGIVLAVWSDHRVWTPADVTKDMPKVLEESLQVFEVWLDYAIPIFRNLCPPCDRGQLPQEVNNGVL